MDTPLSIVHICAFLKGYDTGWIHTFQGTNMRTRILLALIACLMAITLQPAQPTHAAQRCFSETNQCIDGRIREFWEQNGGLAIFGFPIGPEEQSTVDGKTFTVQRFERNRLELHPENARPYDVLLGRLGADRLAQQGRDWFTFAKNGDTGGCKVFAETGHSVCGAILNAWRKSGLKLDNRKAVSEAESLALFGLPLSDLQTETMADGKQYQVQWFERARFELHPENSAPYDVLLGLLGNEVGGAPAPAPAATQASAPAPSGPGSLFVPLPKRMFASYMLEQIGYRDIEMTPRWTVTSDYAAGLADSTAEIKPSNEYIDGIVQWMFVSSTMISPSGNVWGLSYDINEFTDDYDAFSWYYDLDEIGMFTINSTGKQYAPVSGCWVRYSIGETTSGIVGLRMLMNCENKVMILNVLGNGSTDEFVQLVITVRDFFANSFRW
jgi:hypothetical protein